MTRFLVVLALASLVASGATALAGAATPAPQKLPLSGQAPAKLFANLSPLHYPISSSSETCRAYFDQGLAFYYSYDWEHASRAFETAAQIDPDCAMAWWGLSRALDRTAKRELALKALEMARQNQAKASQREQYLIKALVLSKGPVPTNTTAEAQKRAAIRLLDELLSLYDDEEGWFFRAQLAGPGVAAVPFYKALLQFNPIHPGANHEMVHFYENRPALAWPYSENYIKGSPGHPHPYHMQGAHHAMRLGRWDKAVDCFARSVVVARESGLGGGELGHLMLALTHEGRYAEARKLNLQKSSPNWFTLHLAERNWKDTEQALDALRKGGKQPLDYLTALLYLRQDRPDLAAPSLQALRKALPPLSEKGPKQQARQAERQPLENRLWEIEGQLLCQQGNSQEGLALLEKLVKRTMGKALSHDAGHGLEHSAYYMETWGTAALRSGQDSSAEEAFLEALAHDKGSARAALGMLVLCERQGRIEEAQRFRELATRCWRRADAGILDAELAHLRMPYPVYRSPGGAALAK